MGEYKVKKVTQLNKSEIASKNIQHKQLMLEINQLKKQLAKQEGVITKLGREALEDSLTGLANRRAFDRALKRSISNYKRYNHAGSILLLDINQFKSINDSLGHLAGDFILQHIANILEIHTRDTDFIARIGGDEFCIILKEATSLDAHLKAAELEAAIMHTPCWYDGKEIHTTVSIGACSFSESSHLSTIMEKADAAMYNHKRSEEERSRF